MRVRGDGPLGVRSRRLFTSPVQDIQVQSHDYRRTGNKHVHGLVLGSLSPDQIRDGSSIAIPPANYTTISVSKATRATRGSLRRGHAKYRSYSTYLHTVHAHEVRYRMRSVVGVLLTCRRYVWGDQFTLIRRSSLRSPLCISVGCSPSRLRCAPPLLKILQFRYHVLPNCDEMTIALLL